MRFRRDSISYSLVLLALLIFGLFAGLTRWPQAPAYERLARWPFVGDSIETLRQRYLPPERLPAEAPPASAAQIGEPANGAGVEPRFVRSGLGENLVLVPGWVIRRAPDPTSEPLERLEKLARRPVLEHRDRWVRVPLAGGAGSGWIDPNLAAGSDPPLGEEPLPPRPLPGHPPPPERLTAALELLDDRLVVSRVGPYALYTDVRDPVLVTHLDLLAAGAEAEYRGRYGLPLEGEPQEAVILFDRRHDYALFQDTLERIAGLPAGGHASLGIVALAREGRTRAEVGVTLLHELCHLLNRRAVGPALPPWLDEGLADDFAYWGRSPLAVDPYRRFRQVDRADVHMWGGLASLAILVRGLRSGELRPLAELVELEWAGFMADSERVRNYAHSALFVRFLEDSDAARREAWHQYLEAVAAGESESGEALRARLDVSWHELERRFVAWMLEEAARADL